MGVVVHSYAMRWHSPIKSDKYPGFKDAIDLMQHCHEIGAGGIQVMVEGWSQDFGKRVRDEREKLGLFIEGSIKLPKTREDVATFETEVLAAKEAGAAVFRTVCLNGRRYENIESLPAFHEFVKNSTISLDLAEPVVRKHKVKLAIENHKDWRAAELVDILKRFESEWIGVNLDFGNNIALIEDPMEVMNALAPYIFSTHVKDMGVREYEDGFLLAEVPLGAGVLDLRKMFDVCRQHREDVNFNLEMITRDPLKIPCLKNDFWATLGSVSPNELASTLRMVRKNPFERGLPLVSSHEPQQRLATEEQNIIDSLQYSKDYLGMR